MVVTEGMEAAEVMAGFVVDEGKIADDRHHVIVRNKRTGPPQNIVEKRRVRLKALPLGQQHVHVRQ